MKYFVNVFILMLVFTTSCKKEKEDLLVEKDVLLKDIITKLDEVLYVNDFNNALRKLSLTSLETEGGVTIFAPQNFVQITNYGTIVINIEYTRDQLKDHIVKGKYALADLYKIKTLTALSGKELKIGRNGNEVTVNGVSIIEGAVFSGSNGIVHVIHKAIDIAYPESPELEEIKLTEVQFLDAFNVVKTQVENFQKEVIVMDALLSNEVGIEQVSQAGYFHLIDFYNFNFTPSSVSVKNIWIKAYQNINLINSILKFQSENFNRKDELIAGLRSLRAYLYLQLVNYFGNIVIAPVILDLNNPPLSNTNKQQVLNYIYTELEASSSVLESLGKTPEINIYTVRALISKLALHEKNYVKVKLHTDYIIESQAYALENQASVFKQNSREIIWQGTQLPENPFKIFLDNRVSFSILRLSEIYLMNAEACLKLDMPEVAVENLSLLLQRHGLENEMSDDLLHNLWLKDMYREGVSFVNLVRWGIAAQKLSGKGFNHSKYNLLPIPYDELMMNASLVQNVGYP